MSAVDRERAPEPRASTRLVLRALISLVVLLAALVALLFLPAGRWDWAAAWAFVIAYGAYLVVFLAWGLLRDPGLLVERGRVAPNTKRWDRLILAAYTACLLAVFVVCGLDAGRFRWSSVPPSAQVAGWAGLAAAGGLIFWVLTINSYASRVARIQADRGQVVVSSGPYRYVRHPMYLGLVVLFLGLPLALGSGWGLVPGALIALLFVVRTALEDRMLRQELAGYDEYARRVRYRLVPGVW